MASELKLYQQSRHGTRAPTKKRIKELAQLSIRLESLLKSADDTLTGETHGSQQILSWLRGWQSPWDIKKTNGELTREGEEELYNLGMRLRERFPQIFDEDYHPDVYLISATQVNFLTSFSYNILKCISSYDDF